MLAQKLALRLGLSLSVVLFNLPAFATSIVVDVHTSPITNISSEILAFDFISGLGPHLPNTVTISDFTTDGQLGTPGPNTGNVTGSLPGPVTLSTTGFSFFNEYLNGITLKTDFSFQLDATTFGPGPLAFPDSFSLFVLDPLTNQSVFSTSDPTGSDALMVFSIDGSSAGALNIYSGAGFTVTALVPEPSTVLLTGSGILLFFLMLKIDRAQPALWPRPAMPSSVDPALFGD
jgi:hypothetical protein